MPAFDLDAIAERYLNGQSPAEFEASGGDPREYAELVFSGAVWPGEDPAAPEIGIEDVDDLVQALVLLITQDPRRAALEAHREATQFQPLDPASPTVLVQVRAPQSLVERLDAAAAERGVTRSEAIRAAIDEWLGRVS